jgi:DNA-binding transcriptional MerR regulator
MLYTSVVKTVSEDELLQFADDHNVSCRKLADWRSEGLLPKPISSKGLGKGKGRTYEYSNDVFKRVEVLIELTSRYRSFDEIHWKLLLLGNLDQWQFVKPLLVSSFPPEIDPPNEDVLTEIDKTFYKFWKKMVKRYDPFPFINKNEFMAGLYYLVWPYWYRASYPPEAQAEMEFEKLFGSKTRQLHDKLVKSKWADLKRLRKAIENAQEGDISQFMSKMRSIDERIENPKNQKLYRFLHIAIPGVPVRLIWMMRAHNLAMLYLSSQIKGLGDVIS